MPVEFLSAFGARLGIELRHKSDDISQKWNKAQNEWRPQGDSNPRRQRERLVS